MKWITRIVFAGALLASQMGHGGGCCSDEEVLGDPTGAVCPPTSTLTYTNFGKPFMEMYCTRCHDSAKTGAMRNGAPEFHDFDYFGGIKGVANHVDESAAAGPDAVNQSMPNEGAKPSLEERQKLGEWIACVIAEQPSAMQ